MSTTALRRPAMVVLVLAALFALAGCGSSGVKACNLAGCCGAGNDACPAPQYLYATGLNGQVAGFPVGPGGGLGTPVSTSGPSTTLGMAVLNNQFLYVSNPLSMSAGSIDAWSINLGTGALTTVPGSPFSLGIFSLASGLAANNSAQVLYVADAAKIDALKADATGALSAIAGSPFPAGSNVYLTVDSADKYLFASDSTPPGNVLGYTIDSTGALTVAPGSPFPTIPNFVGSTNPSEIVVEASGKFVYVGLLATNQVAAFSIVPGTGALTPVPGSPFTTGNGPLTLATASKFLYVSNAMDGTIAGYSIDATTGILSPLAGSPFAIRGLAMTANLSGTFLYTSGPGGMMTFVIDSSSGALSPVGSPVPFAGATVLTYVQ